MEYPDFSLGIRPEDIYIRGSEPKMIRPQELEGTVILVEKLGAESLLRVKSGKHDLTVKINGISTARTGDELALVFDKKDMHRF
jgi:multiple sugar transport system ATP-binding protein